MFSTPKPRSARPTMKRPATSGERMAADCSSQPRVLPVGVQLPPGAPSIALIVSALLAESVLGGGFRAHVVHLDVIGTGYDMAVSNRPHSPSSVRSQLGKRHPAITVA